MEIENLRNKSKADLIKIIHEKDDAIQLLSERIDKLESLFKAQSSSDKIIELERELYAHQQYSRRETLEFVGIPRDIEGRDIEKKIVELCVFAGVNVSERSFHAVYIACETAQL